VDPAAGQDVVLIVDLANVMGSKPDGWWRDRAGAATRLLTALGPMSGREVPLPDARGTVRLSQVVAVLEGQARPAEGPDTVTVRRAERDGDSAIVEEAIRRADAGQVPLVVTADRGLRARLPEGCLVVGPGWLNQLLGR
jgi:hypothetical protein